MFNDWIWLCEKGWSSDTYPSRRCVLSQIAKGDEEAIQYLIQPWDLYQPPEVVRLSAQAASALTGGVALFYLPLFMRAVLEDLDAADILSEIAASKIGELISVLQSQSNRIPCRNEKILAIQIYLLNRLRNSPTQNEADIAQQMLFKNK